MELLNLRRFFCGSVYKLKVFMFGFPIRMGTLDLPPLLFPCNIAIANFIVSNRCEIRFHDVKYHTVHVYIMTSFYAKIP